MKETILIVKVSGTKEDITEVLEHLEEHYSVIATSPPKENIGKPGFHRFANLVPRENK